MSQVHIRAALDQDVPCMKGPCVQDWESACCEFISAKNRRKHLAGPFWSIDRLTAAVESERTIRYVAETDERVIGFINVEPLPNNRYELSRLYADAAIRNTVIGSALGNRTFDDLKMCGNKEIPVNVFGDNRPGRRFYERHGFEPTGDTVTTVGHQIVSGVRYGRRL